MVGLMTHFHFMWPHQLAAQRFKLGRTTPQSSLWHGGTMTLQVALLLMILVAALLLFSIAWVPADIAALTICTLARHTMAL
jgi:hypothetical protein